VDENVDAMRIFKVVAWLPRPELSQLKGAETAPLLNKNAAVAKPIRRYENRKGSLAMTTNPG